MENEGVVCTLSTLNYILDGSIGSVEGYQCVIRFAFDTGAGFNIISQNMLPYEWEAHVDRDAVSPRLNNSNSNPVALREVVWLKTRF